MRIKSKVEQQWKLNKIWYQYPSGQSFCNHKTLSEAIRFETLKAFAENEKVRREALDNRQSNRIRAGNIKMQEKQEKRNKKIIDREWKKESKNESLIEIHRGRCQRIGSFCVHSKNVANILCC